MQTKKIIKGDGDTGRKNVTKRKNRTKYLYYKQAKGFIPI